MTPWSIAIMTSLYTLNMYGTNYETNLFLEVWQIEQKCGLVNQVSRAITSDIIKTTRNSKSAAFPIEILSSSTCLLHKKVYLSADKMSSDRIYSRIAVRKKGRILIEIPVSIK